VQQLVCSIQAAKWLSDMRGHIRILLCGKHIAECIEYEDVSKGKFRTDGVAERADET
jgi:hypothetical protein